MMISTWDHTLKLRGNMNIYRARCYMVKEATAENYPLGEDIRGPEVICHIMHTEYDDSPVEVFVVFHLNTRHHIVGFEELHKGILNASLIHPRDVMRSAILSNADSIILSHCHPSGAMVPSPEDRAITMQIVKAGKILGIDVLDHVIIGCMTEGGIALGPTGEDNLSVH